MFMKIVRKHGLSVVLVLVAALVFFAGFAFGKSKSKAIPVFIEKPVYVENVVESVEKSAVEQHQPTYKEVELTATAYCACEKCCGEWATKRPLDDNGNPIVYTASGTIATAGRTVAADTSVFPFGTVLYIDGAQYVVEDRGGVIKGNRIDVYFDTHEAARQFGVQTVTARVEL